MTEMREWWANVYADGLMGHEEGVPYVYFMNYETRLEAEEMAGHGCVGRVRVILKPKGAPKRYASVGNRAAWERNPEWCRGWVKEGIYPQVLGSWDE